MKFKRIKNRNELLKHPVIENLGRNNFLKKFNYRTRGAMNVLEREEKRKRHIYRDTVGLVK